MNLGATYYYRGEKKEAVPYFKQALEFFPEHHEKEQILKMIDEGKAEKGEE